jgi:hypothetical protein
MKVDQFKWDRIRGWAPELPQSSDLPPQLILVFGAAETLKNMELQAQVNRAFPDAHILGCSTAGEICATQVLEHSLVVTAVRFDQTLIQGSVVPLSEVADGFEAGKRLALALPPVATPGTGPEQKLAHVLVLSDGLHVNGSDLVRGLTASLPEGVTVTGGLAGDGDRFGETWVFCRGVPQRQVVAAVGLYGDRLRVGFGSLGGWDPFGPERQITRSSGNVLYEMDGRSALGLYKKYLGEQAKELPAAGLLFPLSVRAKGQEAAVVRTILGMDEKEESLTFAGDVPEGAYARLMKANFDRLIDGASHAAQTSYAALGATPPGLAILISCVGRKLVLKQRVEEEVEAVRDILGEQAVLAGFYSYGEISPFCPGAKCELHNQTMTITTLGEL